MSESQSAYIRRDRSYQSDFNKDDPDPPKSTSLLAQRLAAFGKSGSGPSTPSRHFEMATSGTRLAQEIHDEFLVCKICLDGYKNPKSLNCLHTFCENCIENHVMSECTYKKYSDYREFTCPLCRKRTQLPLGGVKKLPDNFLVSSLSEYVGRQRPSKYPFCDICKMVNRKHREASSKCLDCAKLLCKSCVEMHRETKVTQNHSIFDIEIEKDVECKEHPDEVVRFYCEPCETCICVLCTFNEHKDHDITQFGEAVEKYKQSIQDLLDGCKDKIVRFDEQMEALTECELVIKEAQEKIRNTALQYIADIRNREKGLLEELENIFGKELLEHIENKKELAISVDGLRSTCNLTEVILKGKDIELLLLKKDVHEKLSSLSEVDIKDLPSTVSKKANFIPGTLDFGYIQDMDRPLLSKMRARRVKSGNVEVQGDDWPIMDEAEAQTEATETNESTTMTDEREFVDAEIQTEPVEDSSSEEETDESDEENNETTMRDQSTSTDEIATAEIGVNTRSRSLQNVNQLRRSPTKGEGSDGSTDNNSARRRRRRERGRTSDSTQSNDTVPNENGPSDDPNSYFEWRKQRQRWSHGYSIDHDEVFFDADNSGVQTSGGMF